MKQKEYKAGNRGNKYFREQETSKSKQMLLGTRDHKEKFVGNKGTRFTQMRPPPTPGRPSQLEGLDIIPEHRVGSAITTRYGHIDAIQATYSGDHIYMC